LAEAGYIFGGLGLGLAASELVNKLAAEVDQLPAADLADIFDQFTTRERKQLIVDLIAAGVDPLRINDAMRELDFRRTTRLRRGTRAALWLLALTSGGASAFHGYRRNQHIGWALVWFSLGTLFPVPTLAVGFAQGFGRRKPTAPKLSTVEENA